MGGGVRPALVLHAKHSADRLSRVDIALRAAVAAQRARDALARDALSDRLLAAAARAFSRAARAPAALFARAAARPAPLRPLFARSGHHSLPGAFSFLTATHIACFAESRHLLTDSYM